MKANFEISRAMYYVVSGCIAELKAEMRKPWQAWEIGPSGNRSIINFYDDGTYSVETGTAFVKIPSTSALLDSFEVCDWAPSEIVIREVANG